MAVLTVLMQTLSAQDKGTITKFQFGMKATPALDWFRSDTKDVKNDGSLLRASYGFIANFRLSNNYFLCSGIDVNYKGGKLNKVSVNTVRVSPNDSTITTTYDMDLRTNYVELPISMLLKTNEIGYIKYFLQAGIAPGINVRANYDGTVKTQTTSPGFTNTAVQEYEDEDIAADINLFNLSMVLGAGIEYNLSGSTSLVAGITFSNGLIKVTDKKADNPVLDGAKIAANMLGLSIGVLF
ncbi:MAG: hypothetical protein RL213_541 [Bacteroidota bacterium]